MKQTLRRLWRDVSLVVLPVDTYTGLPIPGKRLEAVLDECSPPPVVKPEGYCVFCGLPEGTYTLRIRSKGFHPKTVLLPTGAEPVALPMIPDRHYPVRSGMTWLEGTAPPGTELYVVPAAGQGLKLLRREGDEVTVLSTQNVDIAYGVLTADPPDWFCTVGKGLGGGGYHLLGSLPPEVNKGMELRTASPALADDNGYLFCPIRGFTSRHTKIWVVSGGKTGLYPAAFGSGSIYRHDEAAAGISKGGT